MNKEVFRSTWYNTTGQKCKT